MLNKTKTRISDLLRKSVGLPASDSSCCSPLAQGLAETKPRSDSGDGSPRDAGRATSGCCGGGATIAGADQGNGGRS